MKKQKGFTLVELLVVIAILAILATVSIVGYTSFIGKAKQSNALVELTQIRDLMIAADIDDTVTYKSYVKPDSIPVGTTKYKVGDDGRYTEDTTNGDSIVDKTKRTDLSDGIESIQEADALWNKVSADCKGLKGKLYFDKESRNLVYVLDTAKATLVPSTGEITVEDLGNTSYSGGVELAIPQA